MILFLTSCAPAPVVERVVQVVPEVPTILRTPVTVPPRPVETLTDVGLILADHVEGLAAANGRIVAVDCILTVAEATARGDVPPACPAVP